MNADNPTSNLLTVSGTTGMGNGINLINSAVLRVNGGSLSVQNNTGTQGAGIYLGSGSLAHLAPSGTNTVSIGNNLYGIYAWDGGSVNGNNGAVTIKGNTLRDVSLIYGSRANLLATAYETVACSGTIQTAGGITCP